MHHSLAGVADWCCETAAWYYRHSASIPAAIASAGTDAALWVVGRLDLLDRKKP